MARALDDIEQDIRGLSARERSLLLKSLIKELDSPADPDAEQAWLQESERRLAEIKSGAAATVSGDSVISEARARLK